MGNDLLIKINADAKNAQKAFDDVRDQTEQLEGQLNKVATVSGVAFAAFAAEIFFSVKAFEEAEAASKQLNNALQNQGIFTEKLASQYKSYADEVSKATGIDNDALIKSQAIAQTYLGQTEITSELTQAIADLSETMGGDLNGAAEKIARTIGTGTNAFARQGLEISETATEAERYAATLEFVQLKAGGLAAEMDKADGGARRLATAFGDFQESIGERFAPVFAVVRNAISGFLNLLSGNDVIADLVVAFLAAGVAITGITTAIAVGIPAFLALSAAATTLGISLSVALVGIPLIIGAVIAAVTLLALNWDKSMAFLVSAGRAAVTLVTELFGGLSQILSGAFNLDQDKMQEGLNKIKESLKATREVFNSSYQQINADNEAAQVEQDAKKKKAADKEAALELQHQNNLRAIKAAQTQLLQLEAENASQAQIDLKTKEIAVLKALDETKNQQEKALLQTKREEIMALQDEQFAEDLQRAAEFDAITAEMKATLAAQGIAVEAEIRTARLRDIQAGLQTEQDIERQAQENILKKKIELRNQELADRKKYGQTVATLGKILGSEEVAGAKSAAGELVQLQQSKSKELKAIGKAAGVAQITISTAESAMNIYKGFSTIPIIGPALGVAGAAAAVLFGGERIRQVVSAADGGLIEGGVAGKDSVPAMLMPGELVVPRKNFNDVVGAVTGDTSSGGMNEEAVALLRSIDEKFSQPTTNVIQGDVMADQSFVNAFCKQISDALEFGNVKIFGVNT